MSPTALRSRPRPCWPCAGAQPPAERSGRSRRTAIGLRRPCRLLLNRIVSDSAGADAYAAAGVDTEEAGDAIGALVAVLQTIDTGRPRRSVVGPGHYASVVALDERTGIALCTDGVGTKLIVAEQAGRFETV